MKQKSDVSGAIYNDNVQWQNPREAQSVQTTPNWHEMDVNFLRLSRLQKLGISLLFSK